MKEGKGEKEWEKLAEGQCREKREREWGKEHREKLGVKGEH